MHTPWAVILAGGAGTRFWPRSRSARPKPCLALLDDRTLLAATIDRITPMIPRERVLVVTGASMEAAIRAAAPTLAPDQFLVEPTPRSTAPAIALAMGEIERRGGDGMIVLPSDHRIADEPGFRARIAAACDAATTTGALVLLGPPATAPATGFGWIVPGETEATFGDFVFRRVARFVEKPEAPVAARLLADGALWNAGIFVWTTAALREALAAWLPRTLAAIDRGDWADTDAISIDHGVLEHWPRRLVVDGDVGWDDLGSWPAMATVYPAAPGGFARETATVALAASNNIVDAPGRLVALLGVDDLVIVEDGGVLLVAHRSRADELSRLVAALAVERPEDV